MVTCPHILAPLGSSMKRAVRWAFEGEFAKHLVMPMQGLYCSPHKQPGMINVKQKHCAFEGCTNRPSFNFPGASLTIFLCQYAIYAGSIWQCQVYRR